MTPDSDLNQFQVQLVSFTCSGAKLDQTMNSLLRSSARCLVAHRAAWVRSLSSAGGLQKDLGDMVKKDKVVVFIKGTPAQPMCGFSNAVVQILRMHGVEDYASYNVLEDQDLREGLSDPPTSPLLHLQPQAPHPTLMMQWWW